jgi:hypothetical protein
MRCNGCFDDERWRIEGTDFQCLILALTVVVRPICGLNSQVVCELGLVKSVYSIATRVATSCPLATALSPGTDTSIST